MASPFDTIVAPITGSHAAPVAIVRLSGPEAWEVAAEVFTAWPSSPEPRQAVYGHSASGDDGFALPFEEHHSYTGERTVEISCHGSLASVRALVAACIEAGARVAEPGEFTQRAFLNGRLDLTQAEAVRDTIAADTDLQLRLANHHREGALRRELSLIRDDLIGLLAAVEASVDFSEEVGDLDRLAALAKLEGIESRLQKLLATADVGRILRHGLRIAIVGPPNAGKSSLLNALLGADRAIVTEIPGTTRDFIEERADLGGVPVVLIDTAGLREPSDPVEAIGVQRSRTLAANADDIWYVYDSSHGWTERDAAETAAFERPVTVIANKSDLCATPTHGLAISALTRDNLASLVALASKRLHALASPDAVAIDLRHEPLLMQCVQAVKGTAATLQSSRPDDLAAVSLREAIQSLGEITGETAAPDMIERIFRDFCIGK